MSAIVMMRLTFRVVNGSSAWIEDSTSKSIQAMVSLKVAGAGLLSFVVGLSVVIVSRR
jgi:hypothetical protein